MSDENLARKLGPKAPDWVAASLRAVFGAAPYVGALLAEVVSEIIPNQRVDRIANYVLKLEERVSGIERELIRSQLTNENFTDLLEEGFRQAARSLTEERREYIANLIANGITAENVDFIESKHLLKILEEINDVEIIWLRYYLHPTMSGDEDFRQMHEVILTPIVATGGSSEDERVKAILQESYKEHLVRLNLLAHSNIRGSSLHSYEITPLGRLLLAQIGVQLSEE